MRLTFEQLARFVTRSYVVVDDHRIEWVTGDDHRIEVGDTVITPENFVQAEIDEAGRFHIQLKGSPSLQLAVIKTVGWGDWKRAEDSLVRPQDIQSRLGWHEAVSWASFCEKASQDGTTWPYSVVVGSSEQHCIYIRECDQERDWSYDRYSISQEDFVAAAVVGDNRLWIKFESCGVLVELLLAP